MLTGFRLWCAALVLPALLVPIIRVSVRFLFLQRFLDGILPILILDIEAIRPMFEFFGETEYYS